MSAGPDILFFAGVGEWLGAYFWLAVVVVGLAGVFFIGKQVLGLPLRREENSRLFLDVLELGLRRGQRVEETFLSLARSGDRTLKALVSPRTPWVLGILHILLGLIGGVVATVSLVEADFNWEFFPEQVAAALLAIVGLVLLPAVLYVVAGVQLIRHRASGRWLAIGLAALELAVIAVGAVLFLAGGQVVEGVMLLPSAVLPAVFLLCLTNPQVAAVCGRNGKQPPALVAALGEGKDLLEALRQTPGLVEPRLVAMLEVGRELGDFKKILPACRAALEGATGKVRKAHNYLMVLVLVVTPMTLLTLPMMATYIFPKFKAIMTDLDVANSTPPLFEWLTENLWWLACLHGLLMLVLWLGFLQYLGGPRLRSLLSRWVPGIMARHELLLPWKRKRLQRDFSGLLAILLDAGLPEARALQMATDSTGNAVFQNRAKLACADLEQGASLPEAVRRMDGSGEFHWRLATAARAGQGFLPALRAWHEALDARAFQQEQAAAQIATTSLVFYNGALVGLVMACVFQFLMSVMEVAVLW